MKNKLLSLGAITSIAIPAVAISCGSSESTPTKQTVVDTKLPPKPTTPNAHIEPTTPLAKDTTVYDHIFDNAIRIRNINDHGINWSIFASEGNSTHSANEYHALLEQTSIRKTWIDKFKASYSTFASDVYDTHSQSDFTYTQHYIDKIASGGRQTNPLSQYNSLGFTASSITNIAVIENSNTASTLKQRILVKFHSSLMDGYVEFEVKGELTNPTFRLTGQAGIGKYTPSSDIKFVARSSRSRLQSLPSTAFVVKNGWISTLNEPIWWYDHIMDFINKI